MTFDFDRWRDTVLSTNSRTIGEELLEACGLIGSNDLSEEFEALLQHIEDDIAEVARNARKAG